MQAPSPMAAALEVLGSRPTRRIAVLGDMLELGSCTQAEHYRIGRIAAANCDMLFTLGKNGPRVVGGRPHRRHAPGPGNGLRYPPEPGGAAAVQGQARGHPAV